MKGRPRRAAPVSLAASAAPGAPRRVVGHDGGNEGPNAFARAHDDFEAVTLDDPGGGPERRVWRNATQTVLDRLRHRGALSMRQWAAGERLRAELHAAALAPRLTLRLDAWIGAGRGDPAWGLAPGERAADARARARAALSAVGRPLAAILVAIVWHDMAARDWARSEGLDSSNARPAGMMALRLALDTLADHYGLPGEGRGKSP